ncbi:MAG: hypothetical protein NT075_05800 [Chloroflexi bacterium]|nr:hypothetical protein [Chloroflexota bacterium]
MKLQTTGSIDKLSGIVCGIIGAGLLATAGGWAFGLRGLWAFSFLIFAPLPFRLLLGLGVLLAGLWPLILLGRTMYFTSSISSSSIPYPWRWLWLPVAALLFWLLRERTLYGDGQFKLELLATQTLTSDPYIWKEPLDSLVAYTLTGWLRAMGSSPLVAEALMSVTAGVIYLAAVFYVAEQISKTPKVLEQPDQPTQQPIFYIVGLLALGSSQLWFGHIENYSLVTATSFATMALAVGYLAGQIPIWLVGLLAGCSVSFHPQAAFALPALLLLLQRRHWLRQLITLGVSGLIVPGLTVASLHWLGAPWPDWTNGYAGDHQLFFTFPQILALTHWWDAWNNLWLVAPLAPLWIGVGIWALFQRALWREPIFRYLSGVAVGWLIYHLSFQNDLPRHQDWDLFAIVGPGFTLWGLYIGAYWLAHHPSTPARQRLAGMITPLFTFALLFTVSWVSVNHFTTLIRPRTDQRDLYARYRLLDLRTLLPAAAITPNTPICADAKGCERVAALSFTMPQNGDERPVIFAHAPAQVAFTLQVPDQASFLWLSPALDPVAWQWGGDGVTFQVSVQPIAPGSPTTLLWSRTLKPDQPADRGWQEALVPLMAYQGQTVNLILATLPGPADNNAGDRAGWGLPWLMRGTPDTRFDEPLSSKN